MYFFRTIKIYLMLVLVLLLILTKVNPSAASDKNGSKKKALVIALIPEKNVFDQRNRYKYITNYLEKKLNMDVYTEMLADYGSICDAFSTDEVVAGFFGSFSYLLTNERVDITPIARPVWMNGSSTYSGYIFTHKDSGIKTIADMKDKKIVLVHKATTAGYLFQLAYFKRNGIKNMDEYFSKIYYAGSHDASAMEVYLGLADIGGGKNHIFNSLKKEYPEFGSKMVVLAKSVEVPSNALVVSNKLDPNIRERVKALLLALHETDEGKAVLKGFGAKKFIETKHKDYEPLYKMVKELGIDLSTYPFK